MSEDIDNDVSPENLNTKEANTEEEIEVVEPDFICGVNVLIVKNGGGTACNIISEGVERTATVDDILMMLTHVLHNLTSQVTASQVFQLIEKRRQEMAVTKMVNPSFGLGGKKSRPN